MAKLITNHDKYHIHKTLGLICLLHFLYRLYEALTKKGMMFTDVHDVSKLLTCSSGLTYTLVCCHGMLSLSSLVLPLTRKRNFAQPMIWPEFRLHSITFALRHVVATAISLRGGMLQSKSTTVVKQLLSMSLVLQLTIYVASEVTKQLGSKEVRTTNAMPYPPFMTDRSIATIKQNYIVAQFFASVFSVFGDPALAFMPLMGIQGAAFLMTLVRKGKISSSSYHRIYSVLLCIPYFVTAFRQYHDNFTDPSVVAFAFAGITGSEFARTMRTKFHFSTWFIWALVPPIVVFGTPYVKSVCNVLCGYDNVRLYRIFAWNIGFIPISELSRYRPLFFQDSDDLSTQRGLATLVFKFLAVSPSVYVAAYFFTMYFYRLVQLCLVHTTYYMYHVHVSLLPDPIVPVLNE
jgi:hypothetical protein